MANNTNTKAVATAPRPTGISDLHTTSGKIANYYISEVAKGLESYSLQPDAEQKSCMANVLMKMQELCTTKGFNIKQMNQDNLMQILQTSAMLRLNPSSTPRECYMIVRNASKNSADQRPFFEFGIEGDGNDKLVRTYGVGIKKMYPYWIVRENDEFEYPSFNGLEIVPPVWKPHDYHSKAILVVYPIEYEDGTVQYHIAEREGVAANLKAHISNNLMWKQDVAKQLKPRMQDMTLNDLFNDEQCLSIMSPAYRDPHSREAMIIRKMRNNALKPIPKDFGNAFIAKQYESTFEDTEQYKPKNPEDVLDAEFGEHAQTQQIKSIETIPVNAQTGEVIEEVRGQEQQQLDDATKAPF